MAVIYLLTKVQDGQTPEQKSALLAALKTEFPDTWRDIGNDCYLVASSKPMITQDISTSAQITAGAAGAYLITKLDPYYGWASKSIWEWVTTMKDRDEQS